MPEGAMMVVLVAFTVSCLFAILFFLVFFSDGVLFIGVLPFDIE